MAERGKLGSTYYIITGYRRFRGAFSDGTAADSMLFGDGRSRHFSSSLARFDSQLAAVLSWCLSFFPGNVHRRHIAAGVQCMRIFLTVLQCGGLAKILLAYLNAQF